METRAPSGNRHPTGWLARPSGGLKGTPLRHTQTHTHSPPRHTPVHPHVQTYPLLATKEFCIMRAITSIAHITHCGDFLNFQLLGGKKMNSTFSLRLCSQRRVLLPGIVATGAASHQPAGWPHSKSLSLDLSFLLCWKVEFLAREHWWVVRPLNASFSSLQLTLLPPPPAPPTAFVYWASPGALL